MEDSNPIVEGREEQPLNTDPAAPADPPSPIEQLSAERDRLVAEKAELQEMLLRRTADYDNFRRRVDREKMDIREYASMDATLAILPILDDFERAIKSTPDDEYSKGMRLIHGRLLEVLKKLGLEPVEAIGKAFDPNLHNGIQKEERSDVEDQTVLEEFQKGYHFKSRLLRPAMVKVAVKA